MDQQPPSINLDSVSHDLRSPLSGVQMLLNLLKDETVGPLNEAQKEVVVQALSDCDQLAAAIAQQFED